MIIQYLQNNSFKINKDLACLAGEYSKIKDFKIGMPGEYEISGIFIQAFSLFKKSLTFLVKIENISLCFLESTDKELSDAQVGELNNIDILLIESGKNKTKIIKQIEPRILIPYGSKTAVKTFVQELGIKTKEIENNKLNIKKTDLADEGMEVMVFG